jgi:putative ABC transport system permease protein
MTVSLDVTPDWRVLAFAAGIAMTSAVIFGTAPALRASMLNPIDALKAQGRGVHDGGNYFNGSLLVAQVALSLVLVAGAGVFARSFAALHSVGLGFDMNRLTIVTINNTAAQIPAARRLSLLRQIQDELQRTPDVRSAALSVITPFGGNSLVNEVEIAGRPRPPEGQRRTATNFVGPGWFSTYGVRVLAGRDFSDGDRASAPDVIIVNQAFARRFLQGENPVGHVVRDVTQSMEVVGLVADTIYASVREEGQPIMYKPLAQLKGGDAEIILPMVAVTAAAADPESRPASGIVSTFRRIDPTLSVTVRPLSAQLAGSLNQERLLALLSGFFGLLGLLLACIGLYGVTSYGVNRRRGELGIRIALGAEPRRVAVLVLRRVAVLVSLGIVTGAAMTWWAARFVAPSLVFGLKPGDMYTTAGAALLLILVGVLASWLPARRATRIDPLLALRAE